MSKITEAARDEECLIRYTRVCNGNRETSVWAHYNGLAGGKGVGLKVHDLLGSIACSACHDLYDRRRPLPPGMTRDDAELNFWRGHARSVCRLVEKGVIP